MFIKRAKSQAAQIGADESVVDDEIRRIATAAFKDNTVESTDWSKVELLSLKPRPAKPKKRARTAPAAARGAVVKKRCKARWRHVGRQQTEQDRQQTKLLQEVRDWSPTTRALSGADGVPAQVDWTKRTILGTCDELEKAYVPLREVSVMSRTIVSLRRNDV